MAFARIEELLDAGSFVELGAGVKARITDFSLKEVSEPSDGVITGYGQIEGNPVFVYSQNREVLNGTMGEMHAKKIADLYGKALRTGAPVIGLIDCGGFRLQESMDALTSFAKVLEKQMECQGQCPMITGIFGRCAGGMTLVPALSDFTFLAKGAEFFVNAPHTVTDSKKFALEYDVSVCLSEISGQVDVVDSGDEVISRIQKLVVMLCDESYGTCDMAELNRYVNVAPVKGRINTRALLADCADYHNFMEIRPGYHPEMVTGFMKLNGTLVGVAANADAIFDENGQVEKELVKGLTAGGCEKAAEFVNYCTRAEIPLLTVSAVDGFANLIQTEQRLPRAMASLMKAQAEHTAARVSLIVGNTYGPAVLAMNTKPDWKAAMFNFAWDSAKIGMMPAEKAANILFAKNEAKEQQMAAYETKQNSVWSAAGRGIVDTVIEPKDTRKHLIMAFSML